MTDIPLQKWLQRSGVGSKVEVRALIRAGRVAVDGVPVTRYAELLGGGEVVAVDGEPVADRGDRVVLLMNKPKKHLSQLADTEARPGLGQYLPDSGSRVFPVGRLDYNSEGALLFTNDGGLARRILHPDWHLAKHYAVKIRGHLQPDDPGLARMRKGMAVRGQTYGPVEVTLGELRTRATWVEMVLREGKNRQIRNMCAATGHQIVKLRRVAVGPIELGELNPRCVRALEPHEVDALLEAVGLEAPVP